MIGKSNLLFTALTVLLLGTNAFTGYSYMNAQQSKNQVLSESKGKIEVLQKENKDLNGIKDKYTVLLEENKKLNSKISGLADEKAKLNDKLKQQQTQKTQAAQTQPVQNTPVTQNKPIANNPSGYVTIGSSQAHVRQVMGTPTTVLTDGWWYGKMSWIKFDGNGLVSQWYNGGNNLKVK